MIWIFGINKWGRLHLEVNKDINAWDFDPTQKGRSYLCMCKFLDQVHKYLHTSILYRFWKISCNPIENNFASRFFYMFCTWAWDQNVYKYGNPYFWVISWFSDWRKKIIFKNNRDRMFPYFSKTQKRENFYCLLKKENIYIVK